VLGGGGGGDVGVGGVRVKVHITITFCNILPPEPPLARTTADSQ